MKEFWENQCTHFNRCGEFKKGIVRYVTGDGRTVVVESNYEFFALFSDELVSL